MWVSVWIELSYVVHIFMCFCFRGHSPLQFWLWLYESGGNFTFQRWFSGSVIRYSYNFTADEGRAGFQWTLQIKSREPVEQSESETDRQTERDSLKCLEFLQHMHMKAQIKRSLSHTHTHWDTDTHTHTHTLRHTDTHTETHTHTVDALPSLSSPHLINCVCKWRKRGIKSLLKMPHHNGLHLFSFPVSNVYWDF